MNLNEVVQVYRHCMCVQVYSNCMCHLKSAVLFFGYELDPQLKLALLCLKTSVMCTGVQLLYVCTGVQPLYVSTGV